MSGERDAFKTRPKRDSLAAELERDPQLSSSKRQQRTQVFTSSLSHASLERQLLQSQTAKMELETRLSEKELAIERLERDRRWFADREKEEREERERERQEFESVKTRIDTENRSYRTSLSSLQSELADLQDSYDSLSRTSSQSLSSQKTQLLSLEREVAYLTSELNSAKETSEQRRVRLEEVESAYDDLLAESSKLTQSTNDAENMSVIRAELTRQATYLRTLETTNHKLTTELARLREKDASVEVLREEKRGLERRLEGMDELRRRVVQLEAEVESGRVERENWASQQPPPSSSTPITITQTLSSLRLAHASLLEEHGSQSALLAQHVQTIYSLTSKLSDAEARVEQLEDQLKSAKQSQTAWDMQKGLMEREVGFLSALVASYDLEEGLASENGEFAVDERKTNRIRELESLLVEYKSAMGELVGEVEALRARAQSQTHGQGGPSSEQLEALKATLEESTREREALKRELETALQETTANLATIDTLEQTVFELRGEVAGGRVVPRGTRILQLSDNPESKWFESRQATIDSLKGENEALLRRLREVEESVSALSSGYTNTASSNLSFTTAPSEGSGSGVGQGPNGAHGDLVPRESYEIAVREKSELEDVVKQKEKRLLRLQQVFTSKSSEFRDAIASILGVKLAFYPNGQVRVTSVYDLEASFVFSPSKGADSTTKMQLIAQSESGGPQDLPSLMHYWIENEQCIPGFLASVTLECWEGAKGRG